jgi:hypothetical protein
LNRYALNSQTLGQGTSISSKYVGAVLDVVVSFALSNFTVFRGNELRANIVMQVNAVAGFSNYAAILSNVVVCNTTTAVMTRIARFASTTPVVINSTANYVVGIVQRVTSALVFGVDTTTSFTARQFATAAQVVQVAFDVVMGFAKYFDAAQNVVQSSTAEVTTFVSYAPFERKIIVPEDDRDSEV